MNDITAVQERGMNIEAASEAKVYTGRVYYFDGKNHVDIPEGIYVEVGHYTEKGGEKYTGVQEHCHSTYFAAELAGYRTQWLCAGDDPCDHRKLLITGPKNEQGEITSLPMNVAEEIVSILNQMVELAEQAPRKSSFQLSGE